MAGVTTSQRPGPQFKETTLRQQPIGWFEFFEMVEAAGIEPASEERVSRVSTCVVSVYLSRRAWWEPGRSARSASLEGIRVQPEAYCTL